MTDRKLMTEEEIAAERLRLDLAERQTLIAKHAERQRQTVIALVEAYEAACERGES